MTRFLVSAATVAVLVGAAFPATAQTFPVAGVDISHAAARIQVIPENRTDVSVEIGPTGRLPAITTRVEGGKLVIDGNLANRIHGCGNWNIMSAGNGVEQVNIWGIGNVRSADLPVITLHVPRTLNLNAGGAVFGDVGASAGGHVQIGGCGRVRVADAAGPLDVALTGSGDVDAGAVSGELHARLDGSGDLRVAHAGAGAQAELNGAGDLTIASVAGALTARLDGSGDLRVPGSANGAVLDLNGSGDVSVGAVTGTLRAHVDGSGDVSVASVSGGAVELALAGSGDLSVAGGATDRLTARNEGSGDVRFRGRAQALDADLGGSGDIMVASAGQARNIHDHGSGDVHVGP